MLKARGLHVRKGNATICRVPHFEQRVGDKTLLVGENGIGKSTFLRVIAGLETDSVGVLEKKFIPRDVVYVHQYPYLFRHDVRWNVQYGLVARGMPRTLRQASSEEWMARFGILALANRRVADLSGGERRRVALARAFAIQPDFLLLDEPFADLDPQGRELLLSVLADSKSSIIVASPVETSGPWNSVYRLERPEPISA